MPPAFPADEFNGRLARLRKFMRTARIDVCVVTSPENLAYLTGHATPGYYTYQALVVPIEGEPVLVLRESEVINAQETSHLRDLFPYPDGVDPISATAEAVRSSSKVSKLGVEESSFFLSPRQHRCLGEILRPNAVVAVDEGLANLRLIKSELEITAIRQAAVIVNTTISQAIEIVEPGVSEREVAAAIFSGLVRSGSEYLGMEPFVASGPRSGSIHASWTDRIIREGEPVLLEFAAAHKRYHAALMHTVAVGELAPELKQVADTCRRARRAAIAEVRPGAEAQEPHGACIDVIRSEGLLDYYRKRTGYSIGIAFAPDWGEGHLLSLGPNEKTKLMPGMVVHVVPAIRIPHRGGFGLSATVLVTDDGPEILTTVGTEP
jgi:Xaa-Pro dipeptidase